MSTCCPFGPAPTEITLLCGGDSLPVSCASVSSIETHEASEDKPYNVWKATFRMSSQGIESINKGTFVKVDEVLWRATKIAFINSACRVKIDACRATVEGCSVQDFGLYCSNYVPNTLGDCDGGDFPELVQKVTAILHRETASLVATRDGEDWTETACIYLDDYPVLDVNQSVWFYDAANVVWWSVEGISDLDVPCKCPCIKVKTKCPPWRSDILSNPDGD